MTKKRKSSVSKADAIDEVSDEENNSLNDNTPARGNGKKNKTVTFEPENGKVATLILLDCPRFQIAL